jgi:hypothetical protein
VDGEAHEKKRMCQSWRKGWGCMTRKLSVETCHEYKRGVLMHPRVRKVRVGASTIEHAVLRHKHAFQRKGSLATREPHATTLLSYYKMEDTRECCCGAAAVHCCVKRT